MQLCDLLQNLSSRPYIVPNLKRGFISCLLLCSICNYGIRELTSAGQSDLVLMLWKIDRAWPGTPGVLDIRVQTIRFSSSHAPLRSLIGSPDHAFVPDLIFEDSWDALQRKESNWAQSIIDVWWSISAGLFGDAAHAGLITFSRRSPRMSEWMHFIIGEN